MTDYEETALKKGRQEGKKERDLEIAKTMLEKGIKEKVISEIVGINVKEIEKLKKRINLIMTECEESEVLLGGKQSQKML